jgi:hypothetical protein
MVDGARVLDAKFAGHKPRLKNRVPSVNLQC